MFLKILGREAASGGEGIFNVSKRRNILLGSAAGARKPCAVSIASSEKTCSSSECVEPSKTLQIVLNFQSVLRRCMPCDAQAFFQLDPDTPLHYEAFALLLKEPWLVKLFDRTCLLVKKKACKYRKTSKTTPKQTDANK